MIDFQDMQQIAVRLSYATAHCAVGVTMINGRVDRITDKAVAVRLDTGKTVYFPKKALVNRRLHDLPNVGTVMFCSLAKWFTPDPVAKNIIAQAAHSGMIAA